MSGKDTVEYEEKLLEGKVLLFSRSGIFQVRLYKGDRRYIYRSLKTRDLKAAREEAVRAYYEVEFRKREQLPLQSKRFADVLNEYVLFRRRQNQRSTHKESNKRNQQQTSEQPPSGTDRWRTHERERRVAEAVHHRQIQNRAVLAQEHVGEQRTENWEEIRGGGECMKMLCGRRIAQRAIRSRHTRSHPVQVIRHEDRQDRLHAIETESLGGLVTNDVGNPAGHSRRGRGAGTVGRALLYS